MRHALSCRDFLLLGFLAACSNGGGPAADAQPTTGVDLTGTWRLTSEVLDSDGPCPALGIEAALADLTLGGSSDVDFYWAELAGIDARPLDGDPSSLIAALSAGGPRIVMVLGTYYLPVEDVTVDLTVSVDSQQLQEASVAAERFVTLVDFEVFDGDVMVARDDDGDGLREWEIDDGALRLCGGRVRMVGELQ